MSSLKKSLMAMCLLPIFSQYSSAHFDFVPEVVNGQIATGGHDDEEGVDVDSLRVGGYDFGEVPEDPYNIGDPGFNTNGVSTFVGGSSLRLTAGPVNGAFLSYWDGTGPVNFTTAPAGASLSLSGSPTRSLSLTGTSATYLPASSDSLLVGTFAANGALHQHLGSSLASLTGTPAVGAYLISFELTNPGGAASASDPLYVVYNNGLSEETHDAAISAVEASLVPEPTTLAMLAAGGGLLLRRVRSAEISSAVTSFGRPGRGRPHADWEKHHASWWWMG